MLDDRADCSLEIVLENIVDGVISIDRAGAIVWVNKTAVSMFGWSKEELLGQNVKLIIPSPDKEKHDTYIAKGKLGHYTDHILGAGRRLEAQRKDGSRMPVEIGLACYEHNGEIFYTSFIRDITERRIAEEKLEFIASHDPVTNLPNEDRCKNDMQLLINDQDSFAIIVLSLKHFRRISQNHGRDASYHVLRALTERFGVVTKDPLYFSRIDGEHFAVLTKNPEPELIARGLCEETRIAVNWNSIQLHALASAGVAYFKHGESGAATTSDTLIQHALTAAGSKIARKAFFDVGVFSPALGQKVDRESLIEKKLRQTVETNGLSLALQPKIQARTGLIVGAEALCRWNDPVLGTISPEEFIPIAERIGVIGELDAWVMQRALAEMRIFQDMKLDVSMAINISSLELRRADFVDYVGKALHLAGVDPKNVELELTESALVDEPEDTAEKLRALKKLGVSLSLDDFGTGYSSLSYLRLFPFDVLKIDRSFVIGTPDDYQLSALTRTIATLAQTLCLKTVAEGMETLEQAAFLKGIGIDVMQGYLFYKPVPAKDFAALALASKAKIQERDEQ